MQFHAQQAARALILLGFSVLLYMMHFTGEIHLFINPKYLTLSQAAAFLFLILFFIQLTRIWTIKRNHEDEIFGHGDCCSHGPDHGDECCSHDDDHFHDHGTSPFTLRKLLNYSIIVLPLLTGFMLPAKVLDASIADKKGAMLSIAGSSKSGEADKAKPADGQSGSDPANEEGNEEDLTAMPDENAIVTGSENESTEEEYDKQMKKLKGNSIIEFNESMYSSFYEEISSNINKYVGRKVSLNGFVYKEEGFAENQLVVSRFLVTHCVADASIIGFLSKFPEASNIEKDTWIRVEGIIEAGSYNDSPIPVIKVTKWEQTDEPEVPYLYPVSIRRN